MEHCLSFWSYFVLCTLQHKKEELKAQLHFAILCNSTFRSHPIITTILAYLAFFNTVVVGGYLKAELIYFLYVSNWPQTLSSKSINVL